MTSLDSVRVESRQHTITLLFAVVVVSFVALLATGAMLRVKLDAARVAESDNTSWIVAQLEVDFQNLRLALQPARAAAPLPMTAEDHARIVRAFDIFYSRVDTVETAIGNSDPPHSVARRVEGVRALLEDLTVIVDSSSAADSALLSGMDDRLGRDTTLIRSTATEALGHFIRQATDVRLQEKRLWQIFSWLTALVLLLMVVAAMLAVRLWRDMLDRARVIERAASNLRKTFEASLDAVLVADGQGVIQYCNSAAARMFDVKTRPLVGQTMAESIVPDDCRDAHLRDLARFRDGGVDGMPVTDRTRSSARRLDGHEFPVELSVAADTDPDGRPILITFVRDISRQVQDEENLHDAYTTARRHASAKSRFLAVMSHETRTPLHGLLAALDLVDATGNGSRRQEILGTARDCGRRALEMVNDVLDLTRLGESEEGDSVFSPAAVGARVVSELHPLARKTGTDVAVCARGLGPDVCVRGKAGAFSRALYNLVGNAVKFTRQGHVRLSFEADAADAEDGTIRLRVSVTDDGPGIAPRDQERIFQDFEMLAPGDLGKPGGTGLGLPIARLAVRQMGGALTLKSAPGAGSCFSFEVPLRPGRPSDEPAGGTAASVAPARRTGLGPASDVLVVEDNPVNLTLMCEMVSRLGFTPIPAADGLEAVETASETDFGLILMDIGMPNMDGIEATRRIRRHHPSPGPAIIGITAFHGTEILGRAVQAGMDRVLVKPVTSDQLLQCIETVCAVDLRRPVAAPAGTCDAPGGQPVDLRALVGEKAAADLLSQTLEDARRALGLLRANPVDAEAAAAAAHRAAGAAAVAGFGELHRALADAETALREGRAQEIPMRAGVIGPLVDHMSAREG